MIIVDSNFLTFALAPTTFELELRLARALYFGSRKISGVKSPTPRPIFPDNSLTFH